MVELFNDYAATYSAQPSEPSSPSTAQHSRLKSELKRQRMESGGSLKQTELQIYLSESLVDDKDDFDILRWWKVNSERLSILSKMVRDVLAVPISTVASKSAFSTSGRVLDPFRSSLPPRIVEALVCTQDWLRLPNQPIQIEKSIDDCEKLVKELPTGVRSGSAGTSLPTIAVMFIHFALHFILICYYCFV